MKNHLFIFSEGLWTGKGQITFSMAEDELSFYTQWHVGSVHNDEILFSQQIEVDTFGEKMQNNFRIWNITKNTFQVELENSLIGKVFGKGIIDEKVIAWEFRNGNQAFEGFEIYELQEDGSYKMRAEFTAGEGLRTYVLGTIAKITKPNEKVEKR